MPRYFFDVCDAEGVQRDDEGIDLPSLDAAVVEARQALKDMAIETVPGDAMVHLEMQVRDHTKGRSFCQSRFDHCA